MNPSKPRKQYTRRHPAHHLPRSRRRQGQPPAARPPHRCLPLATLLNVQAALRDDVLKELREKYGVSELVLVGDCGMITASNEEKLAALPEAEGHKTKMGKRLNWRVVEGRLEWSIDEESVAAAKALDGCYVIKTTVSAAPIFLFSPEPARGGCGTMSSTRRSETKIRGDIPKFSPLIFNSLQMCYSGGKADLS